MSPPPANGAAPAAGLRATNARRTREAIQASALRLAAERGYEAITVEDVAADAGCSRRTVFNYFPTKADLILRAPQVPPQAEIEAFVASDGELLPDLLQLITHAVAPMASDAEEFQRLRRVLRDAPSVVPELQSRVRLVHSVVRAALAQRLGADLGSPQVVAAAALAATLYRAAFELWAGDGDDPDTDAPHGEAAPSSRGSAGPGTLAEALDLVTAGLRGILTGPTANAAVMRKDHA
ncbi:DNA-binding transcriptional regulator, AcrR family [Actinomyces denticolens]|uniref:DNA-binding transcriptional regulator, AcrR family n=1 Tax=Actinomyces denticolens TaxID=52767 RepID=A0ABY1I5Q8_9ACTO|nr:TetR family transcriptional regulator [Actinomyces denticolens]SHI63626.1 DNA-binding transcriptional regulator, AcrR family [Actinomyces denticolens]